jgi:hypothetical protein
MHELALQKNCGEPHNFNTAAAPGSAPAPAFGKKFL